MKKERIGKKQRGEQKERKRKEKTVKWEKEKTEKLNFLLLRLAGDGRRRSVEAVGR